MDLIKKKFLILTAIWLRGLITAFVLSLCSAGLAWMQGADDGETFRIVVISAVIPGIAAYLIKSPLPKLPKEFYDAVKDDLTANTETYTKD